MSNSTIWEACRLYGSHLLPTHNNPTLFSLWLDRYKDMETQLLTDTAGEKVEGKNKYTDDSGQVWGPIRWPYKAMTDNPEWKDYPRTFLFSDHLTAIGSTGWDWTNKESRWIGYDFDTITGHAEGIGRTDDDLEKVAKAAPDFVDVNRSTRGGGKHLYIFFDAPYPKTSNHNEHAALARSFLPIMSAEAGFDFSAKMDVCGQVLWIWHKDATTENKGFEPLRPSTRHLTAADMPPNWREHIDVVSGRRTRVRVRGWTPDGLTAGDELDEDTLSFVNTPLDDVHKRILADLEASGYTFNWVHDHHLGQSHTQALKKVHTEWAEAGHPMKGPFDTTSPDSDPGKVNCYLRPKVGGGFDVFRFGKVAEHSLWDEYNGKTHATLNCPPSLRQGILAAGGVECADLKTGFQLNTAEDLHMALTHLGSDFTLPERGTRDRVYSLRARPGDQRLVVSMDKLKSDRDDEFPGWEKKPKLWVRLLDDRVESAQDEDRLMAYWDRRVRVIKSTNMIEAGDVAGEFEHWLLRDTSQKWVKHPKEHVGLIVGGGSVQGNLSAQILGWAINNAWCRVNKPFEAEYPGGREWNYAAAQLAFEPAVMKDGEYPFHPHWDKVFNHCGSDLDQYIHELEWCKEWGIKCGGDYLKAWTAALLRFPYSRLPYLFMYSPEQNTGKSTFHESLKMLITTGVVKADRSLTSSQDFNGELANAVLGIIDETDIAKEGRTAYNKVKDWTTGLTIAIHAKYREVYEQPNTLHLIQTSNERSSLPVFEGDSRITAMEVPVIGDEIGKDELRDIMVAEGPHFMRTLMELPLPKLSSRMRVPVIETDTKTEAMADHRNALEDFVHSRCSRVPGECVLFKDFCEVFLETLDRQEKTQWTKHNIKQNLSTRFPIGKWSKNHRYIGNLVMGDPIISDGSVFTLSGTKLIKETT